MHSVAMITHWRNCRAAGVAVLLASACKSDESFIDGAPVELNDNGAWSWFMDERVGELENQGKGHRGRSQAP